jgi:hypothetical protein
MIQGISRGCNLGALPSTVCALTLCMLLVGCAPIYYAPSVQPTQRFEKAGDVQVTGHFWLTQLNQRAHVQGGFVPWRNFTLVGSMGAVSQFFDTRDSSWNSDISYAEFGPGMFWKLEQGWAGSIQAFYGSGDVRIAGASENEAPTRVTLNYQRLTIQPALSFRADDMEIAASLRVGPLFFHNIQGEFGARGVLASDHLSEYRRVLLWEPAITIRRGYRRIMGEFQVGHSRNLERDGFLQEKVWFVAGFGYRHRVPTR